MSEDKAVRQEILIKNQAVQNKQVKAESKLFVANLSLPSRKITGFEIIKSGRCCFINLL